MNAKPTVPSAAENIQPVSLGRDGILFMQSQLDQKCPLSSLVAASLANSGSVFSLLPEGTTLERAKRFAEGGLMGMGASHKWFAEYITRLCLQDGIHGGQIIFEDPWSKVGDLETRPAKQPYFYGGSTVYYAPDNHDVVSALDKGMREVSSFLLIGVIVSPPVLLPKNGDAVGKDTLALLAQNTRAVFVSAYDQESYVVWQRSF